MNRKQRRKLMKGKDMTEAKKVLDMPVGLGVAGDEPKNKDHAPQVIPSAIPAIFADWFQIQGGIGAVISITFCKHLFQGNFVKEGVNVVLPSEIAIDLIDKLSQAYQHFPVKK